ncbi:hypothetical protein CONCODRAFT_16181 [Conidiobolus coronatus NRRL 28638]|uniref:Voltage-gated hydrogen channel 1 n=1 Tax=Conidiobolus coronatus (strain ATCC 28846 / CBS 209.66 / NRRL 28638) TaxID=796925 RepID=A0A137PBT2_CONC2|nr:hypothetical protein CONCODRAFT_16181 [Conidiobolus coronatus NRRL 28638]|eukprot:KXN72433.1 hypothetical protein CONCODRAFT_16181 [Conidiobolus coronatus NRRL 28638]
MNEKLQAKDLVDEYSYTFYHKSQEVEEEVEKKLTLRQKILKLLDSKRFHYAIICLVMLDLVVIMAELLLTLYAAEGTINKNDVILHRAERGLTIVSLFILCIFVTEILTKLLLVGPRYLFNAWHLLDAIVVIASFVLEVYVLAAPHPFGAPEGGVDALSGESAGAGEAHHLMMNLIRRGGDGGHGGAKSAQKATAPLVIIRLWKFIRIIHAVAHSVEMKNKAIIEKIKKEHNECEAKIKFYTDIIKNLSQEVEDNEKKISELEYLIAVSDEDNTNTRNKIN